MNLDRDTEFPRYIPTGLLLVFAVTQTAFEVFTRPKLTMTVGVGIRSGRPVPNYVDSRGSNYVMWNRVVGLGIARRIGRFVSYCCQNAARSSGFLSHLIGNVVYDIVARHGV